MGVDDEYKMVSSQDDASDHLLERTVPITRSAYKKRNMFASVAVGALIGAAVTFLFSILFAPQGYTITKAATAATTTVADALKAEVAVTTTVTNAFTTTVTVPAVAGSTHAAGSAFGSTFPQVGVDKDHQIEEGRIHECGHTPEEARAKGCVFDVMMQDWMPSACYDRALSERYLATGNWTWWADAEATKSIPLEDMRKGEHPVIFVAQDYHKSHCIYAWEMAVRAMRNDWPLIEELISYDHVMHCRHSTLSKHSEEVRGVRAPTAWTRCALYRDWQGHFPANSISSVDKRWIEMGSSEMDFDFALP